MKPHIRFSIEWGKVHCYNVADELVAKIEFDDGSFYLYPENDLEFSLEELKLMVNKLEELNGEIL